MTELHEVDLISTAVLTAEDVPSSDGPLDFQGGTQLPPIWVFAVTYEPCREMTLELVSLVADAVRMHWRDEVSSLDSLDLDGLRLTLWWEHQRWRAQRTERERYQEAHPTDADFARAVVGAIHSKIHGEEQWLSIDGLPAKGADLPSDEERWERALARTRQGHEIARLFAEAATVLSAARTSVSDPLDVPIGDGDAIVAYRAAAARLLAAGLLQREGDLDSAVHVAYRSSTLR